VRPQEGGGAVSECFQAASRMVPGDLDSWHQEWLRVAERNEQRGDQAEAAGHVLTARAAWLLKDALAHVGRNTLARIQHLEDDLLG
jgi:hypothetical protein